MKNIFILFLLFLLSSNLFSQKIENTISKGTFFKEYIIEPQEHSEINLNFDQTFTALTFLSTEQFDGMLSLNSAGLNINIRQDNHDEILGQYAGYYRSQMIEFDQAISSLKININGNIEKIILHLYDGRSKFSPLRLLDIQDSSKCAEPMSIDQSVWRAGLPDPKPNPSFTQTEHVVIHHSAGSSNGSIGNIYLLHTQTNGWDDIGYNYVIVPDGRIFKGRDGQGQIEQDFVKGAHFCSKNSNTLGICMIGTYSDVKPTDTAIQSLEKLLSWKLFKDQLPPKSSFEHPKTGGSLLPVICGHRDGCATECPGDSLYAMFDEIRNTVLEMTNECGGISNVQSVIDQITVKIFPNPVRDILYVESSNDLQSLTLLDPYGKVVFEKQIGLNPQTLTIDMKPFSKGLYILMVSSENIITSQLIIKK